MSETNDKTTQIDDGETDDQLGLSLSRTLPEYVQSNRVTSCFTAEAFIEMVKRDLERCKEEDGET